MFSFSSNLETYKQFLMLIKVSLKWFFSIEIIIIVIGFLMTSPMVIYEDIITAVQVVCFHCCHKKVKTKKNPIKSFSSRD